MGFSFIKAWTSYFTDKGDKTPTRQQPDPEAFSTTRAKPRAAETPISYLDISKGSMNGFKSVRRQHGGETAENRVILGGLWTDEAAGMSGDADYKMPSNKPLAKGFQDEATRGWWAVGQAQSISVAQLNKSMWTSALLRTGQNESIPALLEIGVAKGSQESHRVSYVLQSL